LRNVDFSGSDLRGKNFSHISFDGVDLSYAIIDETTLLPHDLTKTDLAGLDTTSLIEQGHLLNDSFSAESDGLELQSPFDSDPIDMDFSFLDDLPNLIEEENMQELAPPVSLEESETRANPTFAELSDFDKCNRVLGSPTYDSAALAKSFDIILSEQGKLYSLYLQVPDTINHTHCVHAIRINDSEAVLFHVDNELPIHGAYAEAMVLINFENRTSDVMEQFVVGLDHKTDWNEVLCSDLDTLVRCDAKSTFPHSTKGHLIVITDPIDSSFRQEIQMNRRPIGIYPEVLETLRGKSPQTDKA
jgi:hypothetical protein